MRASRVLVAMLGAFAFAAALTAISAGANPRDDRSQTEAMLASLETEGGPAPLVKDAVKRSRDLLERGTRMRKAGDDAHGRLAEAAALEWARVAVELVRTHEAETRASSARLAVLDASAASERERAMLEQQLAQNGRLQAELRALTEDAAPAKIEARDGGKK